MTELETILQKLAAVLKRVDHSESADETVDQAQEADRDTPATKSSSSD